MKRCVGITESYWSVLDEDRRIFWKVFCRILLICAALFVTKTGVQYFDWLVGAATALLSMLVIESQRSYRRYSPKIRKNIIRIVIFLGSWSVALLGVTIFSQIGVSVIGAVFSTMLAPELNRAHFIFEQIFLLFFFVGVSLHAILRSFRDSGFEQLIYHWPRYGLKVLLIEKPFKADNFPLFAYFELVVLLVCVFYASMVAGVAKVIFHSIGL